MHTLDQLQQKVKEHIEKLDFTPEPHTLYEPITYTMSQGGKRMRPVLTLIACDMFGGNIDKAMDAAIGIELFHNFTLLHDDIMDNAPIRRGKETVYKKWDSNTAILSGDAMMLLAVEYISRVEQGSLKHVLEAFTKAAIEVCEGQQYDMDFETKQNVTIDEYLNMIRLKTAVLPATCLQIGAIIAEADQDDIDKIYRFGENIGLAFQLQDDLLDVYSDVEKFGKQTGGDIVENKKTYLYLKAFELAKGKNLKMLTDLYNSQDLGNEVKIARVKEIYNEIKVKDHVMAEIEIYFSRAAKYLDEIDLEEERKSVLKTYFKTLLNRDN